MAALPPGVPEYMVAFGPDANCTLAICPVEMTVYGYRPSLVANAVFLALYVASAILHTVLGLRWKTKFFMGSMLAGAANAVLGYAGRIAMHYNPFSFAAFMIQIICITSGPVYYTAAIYVTLAASIKHFSPSISRVRPELFYWIFIPSDIVCLVFQATGGALSSSSAGSSQVGVDLALVGLSLQVVSMVVFCGLFADYMIRYFRSDAYRSAAAGSEGARLLGRRPKLFFSFLALAVLLILARCSYRLAELRDGYSGALIHDETLFIALEGVLVIVAVFCLTIGHPGFGLGDQSKSLYIDRESSGLEVEELP